jgi:hypothetical protein
MRGLAVILPIIAVLLGTSTVAAFSSQVGSCVGGGAAVGGRHFESVQETTGSLRNGGFDLIVDGRQVDPLLPLTITAGVPHAVELSGRKFRGMLLRLQVPEGIDPDDMLSSDTELFRLSPVCSDDNVVGLSHVGSDEKSSATGEIFLEESGVTIQVDVTVVLSNKAFLSEYYYSNFTLQTTAAPSAMPASSIGIPETFPPTLEPTSLPTWEPTTVLSTVPTTSPSSSAPPTTGSLTRRLLLHLLCGAATIVIWSFGYV